MTGLLWPVCSRADRRPILESLGSFSALIVTSCGAAASEEEDYGPEPGLLEFWAPGVSLAQSQLL